MAEHENDNTIEADPDLFDTSSSYKSSVYDTSTDTLTSSIHEYFTENGRSYHAYFGLDKNPIPIDEKEKDRQDMTHEVYRILLNDKLYLAPLTSPERALDLGTGTGIWAIDFAEEHPEAEVIGVDLSPIQPSHVPLNLRFELDDVELPWTYPSDHFDFVHARNIAQGIGDWPKLMTEMKRCVKKGGYVELAEMDIMPDTDDDSIIPGNGLTKACALLKEAMNQAARPFPVPGMLKQRLIDAGYVDVKETRFKQPLGPWPKNKRLKMAGAMTMLGSETGIEAYSMAPFTRILGMRVEEVNQIVADAKRDIKNPEMHAWIALFIAWGRKP